MMTEVKLAADLTWAEWQAKHNISKSTRCKMQRMGLAPETLRIPGTNVVRITPEAVRRWKELMDKLATEREAKREQQRRIDNCRRAAKRAAASANHVSKRAKQGNSNRRGA
jgi:phage regulator Rha-like protein